MAHAVRPGAHHTVLPMVSRPHALLPSTAAAIHVVGAVWKTVVPYKEWYRQVLMTVPVVIPTGVTRTLPMRRSPLVTSYQGSELPSRLGHNAPHSHHPISDLPASYPRKAGATRSHGTYRCRAHGCIGSCIGMLRIAGCERCDAGASMEGRGSLETGGVEFTVAGPPQPLVKTSIAPLAYTKRDATLLDQQCPCHSVLAPDMYVGLQAQGWKYC